MFAVAESVVVTARKREPIPPKLVVLTFDDGCRSDADVVAPLLGERGFGATFFVNDIEASPGDWKAAHHLGWAEIRRLNDMGFEIGNHTRSHPFMPGLTREGMREEVLHIEKRCAEHGIPRPTTFGYPGYGHDAVVVEVLAELGYAFARRGVMPEFSVTGSGSRGPAYDPAVHPPLLVPTSGYSGPDWGMADLEWAVGLTRPASAPGGGRICVLNFHGVPDVEHPWVHTAPADFERYVRFMEQEGCAVIAMRDLARYVEPQAQRVGGRGNCGRTG